MGNKTSRESGGGSSSSSTNGSSDPAGEMDTTQHTAEEKSYWSMMKEGYNQLVNAIIRPPRCKYETRHLGPNVFDFCNRSFERTDFELRNSRGLKIVCSHWEPMEAFRPNPSLPCVIYMHGNSSARVEALPQLSMVLSLGATLVSFDFCGSGQSEGQWVSLGAYEKDDLKAVIEHLRSTGKTSTIALWGRSMGAATALLHGERDPSIAGMVLDSAFADLNMLAEEMVEKGRQHGLFAPSLVVKIAIRFIRSSVQKTAEFDIKDLCPIEHADKCFIPALFIAAEGDEFVPPHHSQKIYHKYAGDKNVIIVDGDHNSPRPKFCFESVSIFLGHTLQIPEEWLILEGQKYAGTLPWHTRGRRMAPVAENTAHQRQQLAASGNADITEDELMAMGLASGETAMGAGHQQDIQNKMFKMLGDSKAAAAVGDSKSRSSSGSAGDAKSRSSSAASGSGGILGGRPKSRSISSEDAAATKGAVANGNKPVLSPGAQAAAMMNDWVCPTCTLINVPHAESCSACDMPREF